MPTHQKLRALEAKLAHLIASPNPNAESIRKTREQIIKLRFDLGLD